MLARQLGGTYRYGLSKDVLGRGRHLDGVLVACTVWSCQLDNGPFGKYETTYNAEIHKLKTPAHDDGEGTGMQIKRTEKLLLHIAAKAIQKACDVAFNALLLQKGATDTIWRKKLA